MKILYFGTVCDLEHYNKLVSSCSTRPSVSTIVFETALLEGFRQHQLDVEILSYPMLPTFPQIELPYYGGNTERLSCGYKCRWLKTLNLPVLKQISRRMDGRRQLISWLKENRHQGMILTYAIPPFLAGDILKLARKYGAKTVAVVPDLLRDMYINEDPSALVTKLRKLYLKPTLKCQGDYDGYIYLTDAMHKVVAPDKPYIVMEGIASLETHAEITEKKAEPPAIMYAGMLHKKYGIPELLDAFEQLPRKDVQLWLFGEGTAVTEIQERAAKNVRICYFGAVSREEILKREQQASLLVNPRSPDEDFTRYSFPSKTVEYMLSGTPLLTTKLPGIPEDYYQYVFSAEDNSASCLSAVMAEALERPAEELASMGSKARVFIKEEKNSFSQTGKIVRFLKEIQNDHSD